jgi:hypothetical protein
VNPLEILQAFYFLRWPVDCIKKKLSDSPAARRHVERSPQQTALETDSHPPGFAAGHAPHRFSGTGFIWGAVQVPKRFCLRSNRPLSGQQLSWPPDPQRRTDEPSMIERSTDATRQSLESETEKNSGILLALHQRIEPPRD